MLGTNVSAGAAHTSGLIFLVFSPVLTFFSLAPSHILRRSLLLSRAHVFVDRHQPPSLATTIITAAAMSSVLPARAGVPLADSVEISRFCCLRWTSPYRNSTTPYNRQTMIHYTQNGYTRQEQAFRLVLWTDSFRRQTNANSIQDGNGAERHHTSSVVFYRNQLVKGDWEWIDKYLLNPDITTISFGELHAISLALGRALQMVSPTAGAHITNVAIYCDNLRVVETIRDHWAGRSGRSPSQSRSAASGLRSS